MNQMALSSQLEDYVSVIFIICIDVLARRLYVPFINAKFEIRIKIGPTVAIRTID